MLCFAVFDGRIQPQKERKLTKLSTECRATGVTVDTVWKNPGPKAGPFQARLGDGSIVIYYWYRFVGQPSLQDADLSDAEKEHLQAVVEKIHHQWTMEKEYLPPPATGTLATLDEALIVALPKGLEIGYMSIVTRQVYD